MKKLKIYFKFAKMPFPRNLSSAFEISRKLRRVNVISDLGLALESILLNDALLIY